MSDSLHTLKQFQDDLRRLGINRGDAVLMHSSFKSLGGIENGAAGFFEAFIDLLGPEGTLILPALSYSFVNRDQPLFVRGETPSCVGYLPEYFRTQLKGTVRSFHASHSCCAIGKYAKELTEGHEKDDSPVGEHSPFARLPKIGGKILMLGCGYDHNTSLHGVEQTAEPPYLFDHNNRVHYIMRDYDGSEIEMMALRHNFHLNGIFYQQRYSRVLSLLDGNELSEGKVLDAQCALMSAPAVWKKGHDALVKDPFFFVEPKPEI